MKNKSENSLVVKQLQRIRGENIRRLHAESRKDPYDIAVREELTDELIATGLDKYVRGSKPRGQFILKVLSIGYPTRNARGAYFDNLKALLEDRAPLPEHGRVVLGLGSGRCGSTTLTALFATVPNSCCTHENPPQLFWSPTLAQSEFHFERLRFLSRFFALVFDACHWWLNVTSEFLGQFEEGKLVCLHREAIACARSFHFVKGSGKGSMNNWAPPGNGYWTTTLWDPVYPTYDLEQEFIAVPDETRWSAILRYVREYNQELERLRLYAPSRVQLVRTEDLSLPSTQDRIFRFIGVPSVTMQTRLNVGQANDGEGTYWF